MMRYFYGGGFCGINGGGWLGMMFFGLLVVGVIVYLIVQFPKRDGAKRNSELDEPLNILNARFAKGEISEEEYKARKAAILH